MTISDKIRYNKLQYDDRKEVAKISALSAGKYDKYKSLIGKETVPPDQHRIIE